MSSGAFESGRAWVFPGVGIKPSGFEAALVAADPPLFRQACSRTADWCGRDYWPELADGSLCALSGIDEQLAAFSFSAALAKLLEQREGAPDLAAGNSFGVWAALHASGALDWEACLRLISAAWQIMAEAARERPVGLCAVVGLGLPELEDIARSFPAQDGPALLRINSNNAACHIYAGPAAQISRFEAAALAAQAISVQVLPLSLPWHHPAYAGQGKEGFAMLVRGQAWNEPRFPLVSSIDQAVLGTIPELSAFAADQVFRPIDWAATVGALYGWGVAAIAELGPGISLTQNARFIEGAVAWRNCRSLARSLANHG